MCACWPREHFFVWMLEVHVLTRTVHMTLFPRQIGTSMCPQCVFGSFTCSQTSHVIRCEGPCVDKDRPYDALSPSNGDLHGPTQCVFGSFTTSQTSHVEDLLCCGWASAVRAHWSRVERTGGVYLKQLQVRDVSQSGVGDQAAGPQIPRPRVQGVHRHAAEPGAGRAGVCCPHLSRACQPRNAMRNALRVWVSRIVQVF